MPTYRPRGNPRVASAAACASPFRACAKPREPVEYYPGADPPQGATAPTSETAGGGLEYATGDVLHREAKRRIGAWMTQSPHQRSRPTVRRARQFPQKITVSTAMPKADRCSRATDGPQPFRAASPRAILPGVGGCPALVVLCSPEPAGGDLRPGKQPPLADRRSSVIRTRSSRQHAIGPPARTKPV
jgi:hypothetical protein